MGVDRFNLQFTMYSFVFLSYSLFFAFGCLVKQSRNQKPFRTVLYRTAPEHTNRSFSFCNGRHPSAPVHVCAVEAKVEGPEAPVGVPLEQAVL